MQIIVAARVCGKPCARIEDSRARRSQWNARRRHGSRHVVAWVWPSETTRPSRLSFCSRFLIFSRFCFASSRSHCRWPLDTKGVCAIDVRHRRPHNLTAGKRKVCRGRWQQRQPSRVGSSNLGPALFQTLGEFAQPGVFHFQRRKITRPELHTVTGYPAAVSVCHWQQFKQIAVFRIAELIGIDRCKCT